MGKASIAMVGASGSSVPEITADGRLTIRCPCCNAAFVLENVALRMTEEPSLPRTLVLDVDVDDEPLEELLQQIRRALVELALAESHGVKARAAELLGLKYSTFWEMVQRLDVPAGGDDADRPAVPLELMEELLLRFGEGDEPPREVRVVHDDEPLLRRVLEEARIFLVGRFLERAEGNLSRAAELAGMKYTTFHSLIQRLPADALEETPG